MLPHGAYPPRDLRRISRERMIRCVPDRAIKSAQSPLRLISDDFGRLLVAGETRIAVAPHEQAPFVVDAVVLEEDTHLLLTADTVISQPGQTVNEPHRRGRYAVPRASRVGGAAPSSAAGASRDRLRHRSGADVARALDRRRARHRFRDRTATAYQRARIASPRHRPRVHAPSQSRAPYRTSAAAISERRPAAPLDSGQQR